MRKLLLKHLAGRHYFIIIGVVPEQFIELISRAGRQGDAIDVIPRLFPDYRVMVAVDADLAYRLRLVLEAGRRDGAGRGRAAGNGGGHRDGAVLPAVEIDNTAALARRKRNDRGIGGFKDDAVIIDIRRSKRPQLHARVHVVPLRSDGIAIVYERGARGVCGNALYADVAAFALSDSAVHIDARAGLVRILLRAVNGTGQVFALLQYLYIVIIGVEADRSVRIQRLPVETGIGEQLRVMVHFNGIAFQSGIIISGRGLICDTRELGVILQIEPGSVAAAPTVPQTHGTLQSDIHFLPEIQVAALAVKPVALVVVRVHRQRTVADEVNVIFTTGIDAVGMVCVLVVAAAVRKDVLALQKDEDRILVEVKLRGAVAVLVPALALEACGLVVIQHQNGGLAEPHRVIAVFQIQLGRLVFARLVEADGAVAVDVVLVAGVHLSAADPDVEAPGLERHVVGVGVILVKHGAVDDLAARGTEDVAVFKRDRFEVENGVRRLGRDPAVFDDELFAVQTLDAFAAAPYVDVRLIEGERRAFAHADADLLAAELKRARSLDGGIRLNDERRVARAVGAQLAKLVRRLYGEAGNAGADHGLAVDGRALINEQRLVAGVVRKGTGKVVLVERGHLNAAYPEVIFADY